MAKLEPSFSEMILPAWRRVWRKMLTEQTGIDCSKLSDEALDKIAAAMAPEDDED